MIFRTKDPSGCWVETTAPTREKAKSNFVYRFTRPPYGMFRSRAEAFVGDDVVEVRK